MCDLADGSTSIGGRLRGFKTLIQSQFNVSAFCDLKCELSAILPPCLPSATLPNHDGDGLISLKL